MDKFTKWLDLAQQYNAESFWKQIFSDKQSSFQSPISANPFSIAKDYFPKCDLFEETGEIVLEVEIPGIKKEDIHLSVHEQTLTLTGEFKSLKPKRKYFIKERANLKFKKELILPFPVNLEKGCSHLKDGILTIRMPIVREEVEDIPISSDNQDS